MHDVDISSMSLDALESRPADSYHDLVHGETDSERFFALITSEIRAGGMEEGIAAAVRWMARELPLYSINMLLATPTDLWALRYPETNPLVMMERAVGGPTASRHLDAASSAGTVRVRSGGLAEQAAVIFASEPMDEDPGWRSLEPGEPVHVDDDLRVTSRMVLDGPPAHRLRLEDLDVRTAESQRDPRSRVAMTQPPAIEVELTADGDVPRHQARAARELLASLGHYTRHPITGARLTLRKAGPGRSGRPYTADASLLADGRLLAAHAAGESAERAAELVTERLKRQLRRTEEAEPALRNEPRVIERALADLEVDLRYRPEAGLKPPDERRIVHRHTYLDVPLSTLKAVAELLDLDLSFYLFRHVRTGEDVVVHRHDDGRVGLLFPPGSVLADENDIVTPEPSRYDGPLTLAQAREEMDWLNHRFLYFIDAEDGRGRVLYLRHDGDYGLVQPVDHR